MVPGARGQLSRTLRGPGAALLPRSAFAGLGIATPPIRPAAAEPLATVTSTATATAAGRLGAATAAAPRRPPAQWQPHLRALSTACAGEPALLFKLTGKDQLGVVRSCRRRWPPPSPPLFFVAFLFFLQCAYTPPPRTPC
jgi:hypothetical protein